MRMSNDTFNLPRNTLRSHISKEDSGFRKCILAESNVAATLYYLYNFVFELICLGLGRSTVCRNLRACLVFRRRWLQLIVNHSVVLQGLVENRYLLRDIFVAWTHDARIFNNSPLYKECQKRSFLPINMLKQIRNVELSPLILADLAYSLENWLMKPYSDGGNLRPDEARFNFALIRSRVVVENAFGRFKGVSNVLQRD